MFDLVKHSKLGPTAAQIYAYVYTAERDAAFLSHNAKGEFMGSIGPTAKLVLCQFFPVDCETISLTQTDEYSKVLADIVIEKIRNRIQIDQQAESAAAQHLATSYWSTRNGVGMTISADKPWLIKSVASFKAPPPLATDTLKLQANEINKKMKNISIQQQEAIVYWAAGPGTPSISGIWLNICNNYMWDNPVSLQTALTVRSVLAMGLADSSISAFYSKYSYLQMQPGLIDPTLHSIIPTPNYPSYPSVHAYIAGTAAIILTYYFPANKATWMTLAEKSEMSRILTGLQYPMDIQVGADIGKKIGLEILSQLKKKAGSDEKI